MLQVATMDATNKRICLLVFIWRHFDFRSLLLDTFGAASVEREEERRLGAFEGLLRAWFT